MSSPRVRFAPSPTGYLHVGGARTALFNWLYARRTGGIFVLRIEDTDMERSSWEMVAGILDGMRWLGLDWDEGPEVGGPHGPYFQSERLDRYREAAARLVASGLAYYCYCNPDDITAKRAAAEAAGQSWSYDRACASLSDDEIAAREAAGAPRAIRFRMPDGTTAYDDAVHGKIEFDNAVIEDFVVLRSDRYPTYHLSVVVDDIEMGITDVVRGDDHISNTPKQVLLYEALGAPVPRFAHVPLILGPDKRRLSKRHGATSVMEYERQGFLPEAMFNFLALLGWSPGAGDREVFTREELVEAFSLDGISSSNAVFNPEKLEWFKPAHRAAWRRRDHAADRAGASRGGRVERRARRRAARVVPPGDRDPQAAREEAARSRRTGPLLLPRSGGIRRGGREEALVGPRAGWSCEGMGRRAGDGGTVLRGSDRDGAARVRRVAGHQGGDADPRDPCRSDRAGG
jgi:glutamyl-tRNA synthetase